MTFSRRLTPWLYALVTMLPLSGFAAEVGTITELEGKATLMRDSGPKAALLGANVHAQDIIETDKTGIVEITFADQSVVTVGQKSQLIIDAFVYNPEAKKGNHSALHATKGFFHFVSGKLARDKVKIKTPVSTIGIRGTELAGEIMPNGGSLISLVECCVDVRNDHGEVNLNRVGTFTEVKSRRTAPTTASLTPDWWAEQATAALGKTRQQLGLEELDEMSLPGTSQPDSKRLKSLTDEEHEFTVRPGDHNNRKSYPFFKDSLIK